MPVVHHTSCVKGGSGVCQNCGTASEFKCLKCCYRQDYTAALAHASRRPTYLCAYPTAPVWRSCDWRTPNTQDFNEHLHEARRAGTPVAQPRDRRLLSSAGIEVELLQNSLKRSVRAAAVVVMIARVPHAQLSAIRRREHFSRRPRLTVLGDAGSHGDGLTRNGNKILPRRSAPSQTR